ncbi:24061_t:CDS:2 [Cetraspora pellucida]|uniref:24061_t:CDS:1 n=1 Tax=Cetraspora pellucida TaxID=1433469 RepID=A0A9N9K0F9_9GLOM|nr:24061_t:CDS:2 [Cetraspora pellucida]
MDVFGRTLHDKLQYKYNNQDFKHVRCATHVLNLAVSEDLKKIFQINERSFLVPDLDVPF